jgi:hypothetical protein
MHAVHNNVIQAFFDRITIDTGYTQYFAGEFGLGLLAPAWQTVFQPNSCARDGIPREW